MTSTSTLELQQIDDFYELQKKGIRLYVSSCYLEKLGSRNIANRLQVYKRTMYSDCFLCTHVEAMCTM